MRFFLIIVFLLVSSFSFAEKDIDVVVSKKIINASRIQDVPKIDGILDDEVWKNVPIATDFIQNSPNPGNKPSQKTEVKVLYDNTAMYIGATMYDVSKDSIMRQLSQRDEEENTDLFAVFLDTYKDGQSGYGFVVHPTGVQWDARYSATQGQDVSWNAVWISAVSMDENNWYVEMKIPYSAIRFPEKPIQEWGINFARKIRRIREFNFWNEVNPEVNGFVNQWGTLMGISDVEAPVRLMFTPYVAGYVEHYPYNVTGKSNYSKSINGGMDVKYGINDAFTLDMTLIPDFGQVQSDNQVLNLSPFEVQFNENRPFFMEGTELFNKGSLFYSRRLGGTPINYNAPYNQLDDNEEVIDNPVESQLLNATKISGRTKSGLGIGVFNGVTKSMFATVKDTVTGQTREVLTDPLTNYNILVLDQNLKNNSYVTLINTNVTRSGSFYDANVTGGMFKLNTKKNVFSLSGKGIVSQKYFSSDSVSLGHRANIDFVKEGGNFKFGIGYNEIDDTYDPNDLGYLYNNNIRDGYARIGYNIYKPFWKLLEFWSSIRTYNARIYNPDKYADFNINTEIGGTFKNWISAGLFYTAEPLETYDFYEPRVWGRFHAWQTSNNFGGWISSDYRKRIALDLNTNYRKFSAENRYRFNITAGPRFRFSNKFSIVYTLGRYEFVNDEGAALDLYGRGTFIGNDIIFGKRNQTTYENVLSANYIFTNKMGLTLRVRHYWSNVKYNTFHVLDENGHLTPSNYDGLDFNGESLHNTNFNAFNVDMVYRWVFAPGSEISMVYKTSLLALNNNISASYAENFNKTFEEPRAQSFSIKVLYYIDYLSLKKKK
ncbi:MAG: carbohydrate binding family 9 domain-containing protein [Bacteroidetes bacterium]|nr:carbohydrate binding family 9 domain-containing protein [Bacteroidota bacterium]